MSIDNGKAKLAELGWIKQLKYGLKLSFKSLITKIASNEEINITLIAAEPISIKII